MTSLIITKRAREDIGPDPFCEGMDELKHRHPVWFASYPRCSHCCETPCQCEELDALDRGETDVVRGEL